MTQTTRITGIPGFTFIYATCRRIILTRVANPSCAIEFINNEIEYFIYTNLPQSNGVLYGDKKRGNERYQMKRNDSIIKTMEDDDDDERDDIRSRMYEQVRATLRTGARIYSRAALEQAFYNMIVVITGECELPMNAEYAHRIRWLLQMAKDAWRENEYFINMADFEQFTF